LRPVCFFKELVKHSLLPLPDVEHLCFTVIHNNFSVLQGGEEFVLEIANLNEIITEIIKAETGKRLWKEITPPPLLGQA
jgi:hypothetical protein